jgi:secreted trypsin-like serine protease
VSSHHKFNASALSAVAIILVAPVIIVTASGATKQKPQQPEGLSIESDFNYRDNAAAIANIKIWGGVRVIGGAYPSVVGITRAGSKKIQCTGTLIEKNVVLTAGHCVCRGIWGSVVFGDAEGSGTYVPVKNRKSALNNCAGPLTDGLDIGVLVLTQASAVVPTQFQSDTVIDVATSYQAVGFGGFAYDSAGNLIAGEKRETVVPSATNNCRGNIAGSSRTYAGSFGCAPGKEIVAGKAGLGRDTCKGDSGGPLLTNPQGTGVSLGGDGSALRVAGVTSRPTTSSRVECGDGGVYVRLTESARQWIERTVGALQKASGEPNP